MVGKGGLHIANEESGIANVTKRGQLYFFRKIISFPFFTAFDCIDGGVSVLKYDVMASVKIVVGVRHVA